MMRIVITLVFGLTI